MDVGLGVCLQISCCCALLIHVIRLHPNPAGGSPSHSGPEALRVLTVLVQLFSQGRAFEEVLKKTSVIELI